MKKFANSEYEDLIEALIGDIFYTGIISNTTKIGIIRRYSEIIIRKIFDIPETERMTIGGKKIKEAVEKQNNKLLTNAIKTLHQYGDDNTHTEKTSIPTEEEFELVVNSLFDLLAYLFINYFTKYRFGTNERVMSSFSILPPILRFKVLNNLYENDTTNIAIIDKLVLAILKSKSKKEALDWIEEKKEELQTLSIAKKEVDEEIINRLGKSMAEKIFSSRPKNMYLLCFEKINSVAEQLKQNGLSYSTFEEAKRLYEMKGVLPESSDENKEFNSIMQFCYLGRRIEKNDYSIEKYIVSDIKCLDT